MTGGMDMMAGQVHFHDDADDNDDDDAGDVGDINADDDADEDDDEDDDDLEANGWHSGGNVMTSGEPGLGEGRSQMWRKPVKTHLTAHTSEEGSWKKWIIQPNVNSTLGSA